LYPKLSVGGFCIIDDFHTFSECRKAVEEYRRGHGIADTIEVIDDHGVFWRKS
jgi:O-methyltransferase